MGYAPIALILTPPDPAESGTTLAVYADDGDRFPATPFTALIFPVQTRPELGVNAEEVDVVDIDGDTFAIIRSVDPPPIAITQSLQISALRTMTNYSEGESITLAQVFPADDTNVVLTTIDPQGVLSAPALTEAVDDAGSAYSATLIAEGPGRWVYVFKSDQRVEPETDFYIRFSELG